MIDTPVNTALSSTTLDNVLGYIRQEKHQFEGSFGDGELTEQLISIDEETWQNDMRRYRTHVEELVKKFKEAGIEIDTVRDFGILKRMSRIGR